MGRRVIVVALVVTALHLALIASLIATVRVVPDGGGGVRDGEVEL